MAKKMLVFCGSDDPHKALPPFTLGCAAQAMDMELTLFFTLTGLNIIKKGGAEQIARVPGSPHSVAEFLQIARDNGAKLIACSAMFPVVDAKEEDFIEGVQFGGAAEFVSLAEEADIVLTFC